MTEQQFRLGVKDDNILIESINGINFNTNKAKSNMFYYIQYGCDLVCVNKLEDNTIQFGIIDNVEDDED